ncbi:hypothetical protein JZ751_006554 [Albula glossodonta]|uniref:Uncharacterized protein n=1 Tax=Albula glossodonta TaxID=121402 RepID=A0A8T2N2Y4_9TELE|nr:hypothetical protein JZ751_006554 [Albula glossodonta]
MTLAPPPTPPPLQTDNHPFLSEPRSWFLKCFWKHFHILRLNREARLVPERCAHIRGRGIEGVHPGQTGTPSNGSSLPIGKNFYSCDSFSFLVLKHFTNQAYVEGCSVALAWRGRGARLGGRAEPTPREPVIGGSVSGGWGRGGKANSRCSGAREGAHADGGRALLLESGLEVEGHKELLAEQQGAAQPREAAQVLQIAPQQDGTLTLLPAVPVHRQHVDVHRGRVWHVRGHRLLRVSSTVVRVSGRMRTVTAITESVMKLRALLALGC